MWSSRHLRLVKSGAAENAGPAAVHAPLDVLWRVRGGWRPDERVLPDACYAERWSITRHDDMYQFVGMAAEPKGSSLTIGTVLAVAPEGRWALLFPDRWVRLGAPSPDMPPFDPAEVSRCAEEWLLRQQH